jgi:hypothetical protein
MAKGEYDNYEPGTVIRGARDSGLLGVTFKWGCIAIVAVLAMSVCTGVVGFAGGWWDTGVKVVSPENVKAQFQFAYDDIKAMNAVASNVCSAIKSRDGYTKGSEPYIQRDSQVQAYEQNYQRIAAEYNAHMADMFRAKYVKPSDVPSTAPTLQESMSNLCPGVNA